MARPTGARLQTSPYAIGAGRTLCCEVIDEVCGFGSFELCDSEEIVQLPELAWDGVPEAWRPYTLVQTWSGEYQEGQSFWSDGYGSPYDPAGLPIAVPSDEYCLRIEVLDLRDGSVYPATECVPHIEVDTYARENDLAAFVKNTCNGSTAFWEDSGEPFEPEAQGCAIDGTRSGWGGLLALVVLLRLRKAPTHSDDDTSTGVPLNAALPETTSTRWSSVRSLRLTPGFAAASSACGLGIAASVRVHAGAVLC